MMAEAVTMTAEAAITTAIIRAGIMVTINHMVKGTVSPRIRTSRVQAKAKEDAALIANLQATTLRIAQLNQLSP
jgi:hypothetical protein